MKKEHDKKDRDSYLEGKIRQVSERQKRQQMRKAGRAGSEEQKKMEEAAEKERKICLLYTSPSPRD